MLSDENTIFLEGDRYEIESTSSTDSGNNTKRFQSWGDAEKKRMLDMWRELRPKFDTSRILKKADLCRIISKKLTIEFGRKFKRLQVYNKLKQLRKKEITDEYGNFLKPNFLVETSTNNLEFDSKTEFEFENSITENVRVFWKDEQVAMLLELYNELVPKSRKEYPTKRKMLAFIAVRLNKQFNLKLNYVQVENKLKTIKKSENQQCQEPLRIGTEHGDTIFKRTEYTKNTPFPTNLDLTSVKAQENSKLPKGKGKKKLKWTKENTKKMILLYDMLIPNLGQTDKFKSIKNIFEIISEELSYEFGIECTGQECRKLYKDLQRSTGNKKLPINLLEYETLNNKNQNNENNLEEKISMTEEYLEEYEDEFDNSDPFQEEIEIENKLPADQYLDDNMSIYEPCLKIKREDRSLSSVKKKLAEMKVGKFFNKDLMQQYLKLKTEQEKQKQKRHEELMIKLENISKSMLELKKRNRLNS